MDQPNGQDQGLPFAIQAQYIKDLSFENPNPIEIFVSNTESKPNVNIDIQVQGTPIAQDIYEVVLDIRVEAKQDDKIMYMLELSYAAAVTCASDLAKDIVNQVIMVYTPATLFPFARNIVADVTRDGGYAPLMLAPVDFMALFESQQKNQQDQSAPQQLNA